MLRTRMTGVLAAMVAAVVLVPAGAASAQTETIDDGSGDVWQNFYDVPTGESSYEPVGSPPNTDIDKLTVTHARKWLTVKAKWVDLVEDDSYKTGITAFIRLDSGDGVLHNFHVNDDWDDPFVGLRMVPLTEPGAKDYRMRCRQMSVDIDLERNTMTSRVPTSCLGNPRWVQVHGMTASGSEDENGQAATSYQDSPHTDGYQDYFLHVQSACFTECEGWTAELRRKR